MSNTLTIASAQELAAGNQAHFPNESQEYRVARNALLAEEINLRRQIEQVAAQRSPCPSAERSPGTSRTGGRAFRRGDVLPTTKRGQHLEEPFRTMALICVCFGLRIS